MTKQTKLNPGNSIASHINIWTNYKTAWSPIKLKPKQESEVSDQETMTKSKIKWKTKINNTGRGNEEGKVSIINWKW